MKKLSNKTIALDLRPLQGLHRYRGIGVYIRSLVKAISDIDRQNHYVLYVFGNGSDVIKLLELPTDFSYEIRSVSTLIRNETVYKFIYSWRKYAPLDLIGVDIMLQPDVAFGVAKAGIPTVGVFYDAIPLIFPEQHFGPSVWKVLRDKGFKTALAHSMNRRVYDRSLARFAECTALIAISNATKQDAKKFLKYKRDIIVIPLATNIKEIKSKVYDPLVPTNEYVLYVGGGDYRKNVHDALEAYRELKKQQPSLELVMVGRDFEDRQLNNIPELKDQILSINGVRRIGYVEDEDMLDLYTSARLFLFPSKYEGFGIPVLEAMLAGCPVVAYANSSIPDIVQESFPLAHTRDEFIELAKSMLSQPQRYTKSALKTAQQFSWKETAQKTIRVLEESHI